MIAGAISNELSLFFKNVEMPIISSVGGRKIISGNIGGKFVKILLTGPGLVNTVQALSAAIENSRPSLIIQTGTAGAFKTSGLQIGDVGIATEEIDIHLGIEPEHEDLPLIELPFPLIKHSHLIIKNRYPFKQEMVNQAYKLVLGAFAGKSVNCFKGRFVTVATITATDKRAKRLYRQFQPCMENMEGSGAAHLSIHYKIPFLEIRSASNFAGKRDRDSWNFTLAVERASEAVMAFIRNVDYNILTQLSDLA